MRRDRLTGTRPRAAPRGAAGPKGVILPGQSSHRFAEFGLFDALDEAVLAADVGGNIIFANEAASALLGWAADDLIGRPLSILVPERLVAAHRRGFARFANGADLRFAGQPLRLAARRKDGEEAEIDLVLSVIEHDGDRAVVATIRPADTHAIIEDPAAAVVELQQHLRNSDSFGLAMSRMVAALGRRMGFDYAALWVPDERIERLRTLAVWETAAGAFSEFVRLTRRMTLARSEGLPGRAWESGVPVWSEDIGRDRDFDRFDVARREGLRGGLVFPVLADHDVVGVIELYSVRARELDATIQRGLVRIGAELGPLLARRLRDEAAALERARLELALDGGAMGVWNWDIATNIVTWSDTVQAMLGRQGPFLGSVDDFVAVLHPDDRERVLAAYQATVEPDGDPELDIEYRVVRDDGEVRWLLSRGRALRTDDGLEFSSLTGITTDVTDRKEAEFTRESEHARLDLALEAGGMGVWDWDLDSDEVRLSVPLQIEFGLPPRAPAADFAAHFHPEDLAEASKAVRQAIETNGRYAFEARVLRPQGDTRWMAARGAAIRNPDGSARSLMGVATDVTERRVAEERLQRKSKLLESLNSVGRAITSNLDLDRVVQMITDAATQLTSAEVGAFFYNVVDETGERYTLYTLSGASPDDFAGFPMPRNTAVFEPTFSGRSVVRLSDVTSDERYGHTPPHFGMPDGHLPVRSYLAVPVVAGDGEVFGGLFFGHSEPGRFDEHQEALAVGIAAQGAVAIANARLYRASLTEVAARQRAYEERDQVALTLQRSLLPPTMPEVPHLRFGAQYVPGRELVGGDFYDAFPLGRREWGMVIGDVCGKGPEAAAATALARYTTRAAAALETEPREVLRLLNRAFLEDPATDRFCSVVFARLRVLQPGLATLHVAHAGHPPMLIVHADGTVTVANDTGMLVGVDPHSRIAQNPHTLHVGDTMVLYTDGVTEARGEKGLFGAERLIDVVAGLAREHPQTMADAIADAVADHVTTDHHDDVAVLTATVTE